MEVLQVFLSIEDIPESCARILSRGEHATPICNGYLFRKKKNGKMARGRDAAFPPTINGRGDPLIYLLFTSQMENIKATKKRQNFRNCNTGYGAAIVIG